jgi:pyruvate/2-oxoglutarate dehydrogenase complex dihydrolipoamide acyltransferase (E2) component
MSLLRVVRAACAPNVAVAVLAIGTILVGASAADAKCTRLGFSVNDYGKQGPTDDAKKLLDTYIAKWAVENNVKGYTVGKKEVKCELFLDFIVFDEYTCRAEAPVCWGGGGPTTAAAPAAAAPGAAPPKATVAKAAKATPATTAPAAAAAPTAAAAPAAEPAKSKAE